MSSRIRLPRVAGLGLLFMLGCGGANAAPLVTVDESAGVLTATVGPNGGVVEALDSPAFEGFGLNIPAGALRANTTLRVRRVEDETPLPNNAFRVGLQFRVEAEGVTLAQPMSVRLPVDPLMRESLGGNPDEVKVWVRNADGWSLVEPMSTASTRVTIQVSALTTMAAGVRLTFNGTVPSVCGGSTFPCARTEVVEPAVGHAPQPCAIAGGFCLEPLIGGANNPAPATDATMVVGQGFVMYGERVPPGTPLSSRRGIELRMSDLAVSHGKTAPNFGLALIDAMLSTGALYTSSTFQRYFGIDNAVPPGTSLQISGQPMGTVWSRVSATSARNYFINSTPRAIAMFDADPSGARTPLPSIPITNGAAFLGSEAGSLGTMWYVEATQSFAQQQNGVNAGVLRRINADGALGTSIQDTSPPSLLLVDMGGGGVGGAPGGTTPPTIFSANARRVVLSTFSANFTKRLSMIDLTAATPVLTHLNVPTPTPASNGVDGFRAAVLDDHDRIWFVFGGTFHDELFVFDPATNSTQGVPTPGFRPARLGFDGAHVIVSARAEQPGAPSQIFRVRPFGS